MKMSHAIRSITIAAAAAVILIPSFAAAQSTGAASKSPVGQRRPG